MLKSILVLAIWLFIAPAAAATELASLRGPAANGIRSYLGGQKVECASEPEKKCSLASQAADAQLFYGRFPGERRSVALLFLYGSTGGSGTALEVFVWTSKLASAFDLLGKTDDAVGGDVRNVRFKAGGVIEYTATVMASGDAHCCPTGKKVFELRVDDDRVYFRGPK